MEDRCRTSLFLFSNKWFIGQGLVYLSLFEGAWTIMTFNLRCRLGCSHARDKSDENLVGILTEEFSFQEEVYAQVIKGTVKPLKVLFHVTANGCPLGPVRYTIIENNQPFLVDYYTGGITLSKHLEEDWPNKFVFHVRGEDDTGQCKATTEIQIYIIHVNEHRPIMSASKYFCRVNENERTVEVKPAIFASDKDEGNAGFIKEIRIQENVPFKIILSNDGSAKLEASEDLDAETIVSYRFNIYAVDNGARPQKSKLSRVYCDVVDANEFAPIFEHSLYTAAIDMGKSYEKIIQVKAIDRDISYKKGTVCNYKIVEEKVPFSIDKNGIISLWKPLGDQSDHLSEFHVVATDCDGKISEVSAAIKVTAIRPTAILTVKESLQSKAQCKPGFSFGKDMSSAVSYPSCTKSMPLMPSAKVSECTDQSHLMHDISVKLSLDTNGIGKGCDRESHSNVLSHHKCGMKHITDLLPSNGKDWLEHLVKEENTQGEMDYIFDGKSAARIPSSELGFKWLKTFTIASWVQIYGSRGIQFLMSWSDGQRSNYSYVGLYLTYQESNNDYHLGLIMNKENGNCKFNHQWASPFADKRWHHLALTINQCSVQLLIDGNSVEPKSIKEYQQPQQLHIQPKYVIGGRWLGMQEKYADYFQGRISSLVINQGQISGIEVIRCILSCKEKIAFTAPLASNFQISMSNEDKSFHLFGKGNPQTIEEMLHGVAYHNLRPYPTPGKRYVKVKLEIDGKEMPTDSLTVHVPKSYGPQIRLVGKCSSLLKSVAGSSRKGIKFCDEIKAHVEGCLRILDQADVLVAPELENGEEIFVHESILKKYGLTTKLTSAGMNIIGVASVSEYSEVLSNLMLVLSKENRQKKYLVRIEVSSENGRFASNELVIEIHLNSFQRNSSWNDGRTMFIQSGYAKSSQKGFKEKKSKEHNNDNSLLIFSGIFSIALVSAMVSFGVIQYHRKRRQDYSSDSEGEAEAEAEQNPTDFQWDDEGLGPVNITVNPLARLCSDDSLKVDLKDFGSSSGWSDESDDSDNDESESEREMQNQLEWDDSADDNSFEDIHKKGYVADTEE